MRIKTTTNAHLKERKIISIFLRSQRKFSTFGKNNIERFNIIKMLNLIKLIKNINIPTKIPTVFLLLMFCLYVRLLGKVILTKIQKIYTYK